MRANDIVGALAITNDVLEKFPKYAYGYSFRAELFGILGNIQKSEADLSKAIELRPKDSELYLRRALSKQMLSDFQGAIADFNNALDNGADGARVFAQRAGVKQILKDTEGALKDYEMAVKIRPHSVFANMGYASLIFREKDKQMGIEHLKTFLLKTETDWNNEFPKPQIQRIGDEKVKDSTPPDWNGNKVIRGGEAIISKKEPKSFEEDVKQTGDMEQILNLPNAYATLATFYIEVNDISNAEENINKAFTFDTRGNLFYDIRARIRYKKADYTGAIEDINLAMKRFIYPTLYLERGLAFFMLGKEKEAQADFDKFIEVFPKGKTSLDKHLEEAKKLKQNSH